MASSQAGPSLQFEDNTPLDTAAIDKIVAYPEEAEKKPENIL